MKKNMLDHHYVTHLMYKICWTSYYTICNMATILYNEAWHKYNMKWNYIENSGFADIQAAFYIY